MFGEILGIRGVAQESASRGASAGPRAGSLHRPLVQGRTRRLSLLSAVSSPAAPYYSISNLLYIKLITL